ncbi:MAG: type II CAAX endopeptidase family protein [bacterium]
MSNFEEYDIKETKKSGSILKFSALAIAVLLLAQLPASIVILMMPKGITSGMIFCVSQLVLTLVILLPISKKTSLLPAKSIFRLTAKPPVRVYLFSILGLVAVSAIGSSIMSLQYHFLPDNVNLWLDQMYASTAGLYSNLFYTGFNYQLLLAVLGAAIIVPVYEEMVFRGYLQKNLEVLKRPTLAIILTSLIFTLLHFNLAEILPLFILAFYVGVITYKTDSLKIAITCHVLNNTFAIVKMNLSSPADNLTLATDILPIWIAGLILVLGIGTLFVIFKYFLKETH